MDVDPAAAAEGARIVDRGWTDAVAAFGFVNMACDADVRLVILNNASDSC